MSEFTDDGAISIVAKSWQAEIHKEEPGKLSFWLENDEGLDFLPISFGKLDESMATTEKSRLHESMSQDLCSYQIENIMPFGPEPKIQHKIEFTGNHAKVTTDIELKRGFAIEYLDLTPILFSGDWTEYALVPIPDSGTTIPPMEWRQVKGDILWESEEPFLYVVLKSSSGNMLEVGTGDNLWRWSRSEAEDMTSSYRLEQVEEGIVLQRRVWAFPEQHDPSPGNRRFRWYFAWQTPDQVLDTSDCSPFPEVKIPEAGMIEREGETSGTPCVLSAAANGRFRKAVRSLAGNSKDTIFGLSLSPMLCDLAPHLERPNKKELLHWDMMALLDLWQWANRQLEKRGCELQIRQPQADVGKLPPSLHGLSEE